jgi:Phage tail protein
VIHNVTTGRWLAFGLALAGGDSLVVDTAARTVRLNGASRRAVLKPGSAWFGVPPGQTVVNFGAVHTDASATLSASWQDAWI